ncbi:MAG: peroxiredoxin [Myxococcales bacterium]|nr:peroxiredoxin [Myxococcales bacterium]
MSLIGTPAPSFTLTDNARQKVSLESLLGKQVVLMFYPAAFTGVCEKEACTFRDSMSELNGLNATVLGISVDSPFANNAFAAKNTLNFPLLSDVARDVTRAYGVELHDFAGIAGFTVCKRAVFVVNAAGVVSYEWVGANPGIEPDYDAVKAALG